MSLRMIEALDQAQWDQAVVVIGGRPGVFSAGDRNVPAAAGARSLQRAVVNPEICTPEAAVPAGFLDQIVPAQELASTAQAVATRLNTLSVAAHAATKQRVRAETLQAIRKATPAKRQSPLGDNRPFDRGKSHVNLRRPCSIAPLSVRSSNRPVDA